MKWLSILVIMLVPVFGYSVINASQQYVWDDVSPVMTQNGCAGCHSFAASYDALMAKNSTVSATFGVPMINPAKPDSSVIVWRIEGELPDGTTIARMPQGGSKLSDDKIAVIRDWVTQGASETTVGVDEKKQWGEIKSMFR